MNDVVVFEATYDLDDGVDFPDVGEKLVAETLAFAGAGDEAGDIDKFDRGWDHHIGFGDIF